MKTYVSRLLVLILVFILLLVGMNIAARKLISKKNTERNVVVDRINAEIGAAYDDLMFNVTSGVPPTPTEIYPDDIEEQVFYSRKDEWSSLYGAEACPEDVEIIRLPSVKDDTDTQYCIKEALSRGYNDIDIVGGTGGRLDHTIANIQSLAYACKRNATAKLIDKNNEIIVIDKDISIKKGKKYFSVFSLTDYSIVNIKGAFYSGENIKLTNTFPLGVSNEVTCEKADIEVLSGTIVLAISED